MDSPKEAFKYYQPDPVCYRFNQLYESEILVCVLLTYMLGRNET